MKKDQIAINTVSVTIEDLESGLSAIRKSGFVKIEFAIRQLRRYFEEGLTIEKLKQTLDHIGLQCIGGFETVLVCFEKGIKRRENHDKIKDNAEMLSMLGGRNLVIGIDWPEGNKLELAHMDVVAEALKTVADLIKKTKVNLLIEFNWGPVKTLSTAIDIVRRSGVTNSGVLFDPAHYYSTPTKFEDLTVENVGLIKHVHMNDMNDMPFEVSNCNSSRVLPGAGCLDLPAIIEKIENFGYSGDFSIELFNDELWKLPVSVAASRMYDSMASLCDV